MNKAKTKGDRYERELKKLLESHGIGTIRVQLPAQAGKQFEGDVILKDFYGLIGEVKYRENGFKQLYKWLEGRDILFIRAGRKSWLMVVPEELWKDFFYKVRNDAENI